MDPKLNEMSARIAAYEHERLTETMNQFFQEIKHGDAEHQEWLRKKVEDFFKVEIKND